MGRAIPPEWTVNLLSLGKEPWSLKELEDQLSTYHQQWQADQKKQIIAEWLERCQANKMMEKEKIMKEIIISQMMGAVALVRAIIAEEDAEVKSEHLKTVECFNCGKKVHYSTNCSAPRKK
jgi:hypothetical protein